jgi:hypothetical protein
MAWLIPILGHPSVHCWLLWFLCGCSMFHLYLWCFMWWGFWDIFASNFHLMVWFKMRGIIVGVDRVLCLGLVVVTPRLLHWFTSMTSLFGCPVAQIFRWIGKLCISNAYALDIVGIGLFNTFACSVQVVVDQLQTCLTANYAFCSKGFPVHFFQLESIKWLIHNILTKYIMK